MEAERICWRRDGMEWRLSASVGEGMGWNGGEGGQARRRYLVCGCKATRGCVEIHCVEIQFKETGVLEQGNSVFIPGHRLAYLHILQNHDKNDVIAA